MTLLEAETERANSNDGWLDATISPPALGLKVEVFGLVSVPFGGGVRASNLGIGFLTRNTDTPTAGWKVRGRRWWNGSSSFTVTKWREIHSRPSTS